MCSTLKAMLKRDVRHIASVDKLQSLPQQVARIDLDGKTVTRSITHLDPLSLVRVFKTPKPQFLDSGLLTAP